MCLSMILRDSGCPSKADKQTVMTSSRKQTRGCRPLMQMALLKVHAIFNHLFSPFKEGTCITEKRALVNKVAEQKVILIPNDHYLSLYNQTQRKLQRSQGPWTTGTNLGPDKFFFSSNCKFSVVDLTSNKPEKNLKLVNSIRNEIVYITACASSSKEGGLGGILKSGDIFLTLSTLEMILNIRGLPEFRSFESQQNSQSLCQKVQKVLTADSKLLITELNGFQHFNSHNGNTVLLAFNATIYIWKGTEKAENSKGSHCKGIWSSYNLNTLLQAPSWTLVSIDSRCSKLSGDVFTWKVVSLVSGEESGLYLTSQTLHISDTSSNGQVASKLQVVSSNYLKSISDTIMALSNDGSSRAVAINCSKNSTMNCIFIVLDDYIFPTETIEDKEISSMCFTASGLLIICLTASFDLIIFDRVGSRLMVSIQNFQMSPEKAMNLKSFFPNDLVLSFPFVSESNGKIFISNGLSYCYFQIPKKFEDCISYAKLLSTKSSILVDRCKTHPSFWDVGDAKKNVIQNRKSSKPLPRFVSRFLRLNTENPVDQHLVQMNEFEESDENILKLYKDLPSDTPKVFIQALESLRSLVLFVIGLQTTDNEIQSKLVEVLSRCWTLFNQLVTNKPESITKEDCFLLSTNWIEEITNLFLLDTYRTYASCSADFLETTTASMLEVISLETDFHSCKRIINLLNKSIDLLMTNAEKSFKIFIILHTKLLMLKAPDEVLELLEKVAVKRGVRTEDLQQTVLSQGTLEFLHGNFDKAIEEWKIEILESTDVSKHTKLSHSVLYCLYQYKVLDQESLILNFLNWSFENLLPDAMEVLEASFVKIQTEILILGSCKIPSAFQPTPFKDIENTSSNDSFIGESVKSLENAHFIRRIEILETVVDLLLQLQQFKTLTFICMRESYNPTLPIFFAYLDHLMDRKANLDFNASFFCRIFNQQIHKLDTALISKIANLVPELSTSLNDYLSTLLQSSLEALSSTNLHPNTYKDVQQVEFVTFNMKRTLKLLKQCIIHDSEKILETVSNIDSILDNRQCLNELLSSENPAQQSSFYKILMSITLISRVSNLWRDELLEIAALALENLPDRVETADAIVEIFTDYGCPEAPEIDKRVRLILKRWQSVKDGMELTLSDYFVQKAYKFKKNPAPMPKKSSLDYLLAKYGDEEETLNREHSYENLKPDQFQNETTTNVRIQDMPYWKAALLDQESRAHEIMNKSFSEETLKKSRMFYSWCKTNETEKLHLNLSINEIMLCIAIRHFDFSDKTNWKNAEPEIPVHVKPPIPQPRTFFSVKSDENCEEIEILEKESDEISVVYCDDDDERDKNALQFDPEDKIVVEKNCQEEVEKMLPSKQTCNFFQPSFETVLTKSLFLKAPDVESEILIEIPRPQGVPNNFFNDIIDTGKPDEQVKSGQDDELELQNGNLDFGIVEEGEEKEIIMRVNQEPRVNLSHQCETFNDDLICENQATKSAAQKFGRCESNWVEKLETYADGDMNIQNQDVEELNTYNSIIGNIVTNDLVENMEVESSLKNIVDSEKASIVAKSIENKNTDSCDENLIENLGTSKIASKVDNLNVSESQEMKEKEVVEQPSHDVEESRTNNPESIEVNEKIDFSVRNMSKEIITQDQDSRSKNPKFAESGKYKIPMETSIISTEQPAVSSANFNQKSKKKRRSRPSLDFFVSLEKSSKSEEIIFPNMVNRGFKKVKANAERKNHEMGYYIAGKFDDYLNDNNQSNMMPGFSAIHYSVRKELDKVLVKSIQKSVGTNTEKEMKGTNTSPDLDELTEKIIQKLSLQISLVDQVKKAEETKICPLITISDVGDDPSIESSENSPQRSDNFIGPTDQEVKAMSTNQSSSDHLIVSEPQRQKVKLRSMKSLGDSFEIAEPEISEVFVSPDFKVDILNDDEDLATSSYSSLMEMCERISQLEDDDHSKHQNLDTFEINIKDSPEQGELKLQVEEDHYENDFEDEEDFKSDDEKECNEDGITDSSSREIDEDQSNVRLLPSDQDNNHEELVGRKMSKQFLKSLGVSQEFLESSFSSAQDEDEGNLTEDYLYEETPAYRFKDEYLVDHNESHSDSEIDSILLDIHEVSLKNLHLPFTEAYVMQSKSKQFSAKNRRCQSSLEYQLKSISGFGKNNLRNLQNFYPSSPSQNQFHWARSSRSNAGRLRPKSWTGVSLLEDIQELRSQESSELR